MNILDMSEYNISRNENLDTTFVINEIFSEFIWCVPLKK